MVDDLTPHRQKGFWFLLWQHDFPFFGPPLSTGLLLAAAELIFEVCATKLAHGGHWRIIAGKVLPELEKYNHMFDK